MVAYERIKYFGKALYDWLAADATLVSLTGHNVSNDDIRILLAPIEYVPNRPFVSVEIISTGNPLPDIDRYYESSVILTVYGTSPIQVQDILGQIQEMSSSITSGERTNADPLFSGTNIQTVRVRIGTVTTAFADDSDEPNRYAASITLSIWWKDA